MIILTYHSFPPKLDTIYSNIPKMIQKIVPTFFNEIADIFPLIISAKLKFGLKKLILSKIS